MQRVPGRELSKVNPSVDLALKLAGVESPEHAAKLSRFEYPAILDDRAHMTNVGNIFRWTAGNHNRISAG